MRKISAALAILVFLLCLQTANAAISTPNKALFISQKAADYVISKAVIEGDGLKWPLQSYYLHYNPIFQNGAAGVGYFLLTLHRVTGNSTYLQYSEKAARWIISQTEERDGGLTWSHYDDEKPREFTNGWYLTPEKSVSGIARFFLELYKTTGKLEYLNYAEGAARWIINVGLVKTEQGSYVDYNPYHQAAFGVYSYPQRDVGVLLLDLYKITGNKTYLEKAKEIGEWILWTSECESDICKWYDDRGYGNIYAIEGVSPLVDFLYRLYNETNDVTYLITAEKMVNWVETRGVKVDSGLKFPDLNGGFSTSIFGDWDRLLSVMTPADVFIWSYKVTGNQSRLSIAKSYADWLISISIREGDGLKVPRAEGIAEYHAWINARVYRFVIELYRLTGDARYSDYAEKLLNWIIYSAVDKNGFVWPYYDGREFPTFEYGSSGIGYYVLAGSEVAPTPSPTPTPTPTPITSCTDVDSPGYYVLSKDIEGLQNGKDYCIGIFASNVVLDGNGYGITGPGWGKGGIYVMNANNVILKNLTVTEYYTGIYLDNSDNNVISNVNASNNLCGIFLYKSDNNSITNSAFNNNNWDGIYFGFSNNNNVERVTMTNNGLFLEHSYNNRVINTIVNGKTLVYLENEENQVVDNAGQVVVVNCKNITIRGLELNNATIGILVWGSESIKIENVTAKNNSWDGIRLESSSNSTITNSIVSNNGGGIILGNSNNNRIMNVIANGNREGISFVYSNNNTIKGLTINNNKEYGIFLSSSNNNTIKDSTILNNSWVGIFLGYSSDNNLIYNNYFSNAQNAWILYSLSSTWNTTKAAGKNIVGGNYLGGNYWGSPDGNGFSDTCSDADADEICDQPFAIDDYNVDWLPLARPSEVPTPAPAPGHKILFVGKLISHNKDGNLSVVKVDRILSCLEMASYQTEMSRDFIEVREVDCGWMKDIEGSEVEVRYNRSYQNYLTKIEPESLVEILGNVVKSDGDIHVALEMPNLDFMMRGMHLIASLNKFIIYKDFDQHTSDAANIFFKINVYGADDNSDGRIDEEGEYIRLPTGRFSEILVKDDEIGKELTGPTLAISAPYSVPIRIETEVRDEDPLNWDDQVAILELLVTEDELRMAGYKFCKWVGSREKGIEVQFCFEPLLPTDTVSYSSVSESGLYDLGFIFHDVDGLNAFKKFGNANIEKVRVAVIEFGYPDIHPEWSNRVVEVWNCSGLLPCQRVYPKVASGIESVHASMVSGLIISEIDGKNAAGLAWNAELIIIGIEKSLVSTISGKGLASAIRHAVDSGAKVITMSVYTSGFYILDSEVESSIKYAVEKNVVLIAAAGNDHTSWPWYPAVYDPVIKVAGVTRYGVEFTSHECCSFDSYFGFALAKALYSNYGKFHSFDAGMKMRVDFSAPATVYTTGLGGSYYPEVSGTSFSAPIIASVVALIQGYAKANHGRYLTIDEVYEVLRQASIDLGDPGWDPYYGWGLVNVTRALEIVSSGIPTPTIRIAKPPQPTSYTVLTLSSEGSQLLVSILDSQSNTIFGYNKEEGEIVATLEGIEYTVLDNFTQILLPATTPEEAKIVVDAEYAHMDAERAEIRIASVREGELVDEMAQEFLIRKSETLSFKVSIDEGGEIEFSDLPKPDLAISSVNLTPKPVVVGRQANLSVTVDNLGNIDSAAFNVSLLVNETEIAKERVPGLKAGESITITFTGTPSDAGTYNVTILADSDDEINESYEENNLFSIEIAVIQPSEIWEYYDSDGDGKMSTMELINAIKDWLEDRLGTLDLIKVIQKWLES